MGYWKWLGKGIWYLISLRWLLLFRTPLGEALGGGLFFGSVASPILVREVGGYWWVITIVVAFLIIAHGIYREVHEKQESS